MSIPAITSAASGDIGQLLGAIGSLGDPAKLPAAAPPATTPAPAASGLPAPMTPTAGQTGGLDTMLSTALQVALNPMGAETAGLLGSLPKVPNGTPVANPLASLFPGSPNVAPTTPAMNGLGAYLTAQSTPGTSVPQLLANHFAFAQQLVGGFLPQFNPMRYLAGIKL